MNHTDMGLTYYPVLLVAVRQVLAQWPRNSAIKSRNEDHLLMTVGIQFVDVHPLVTLTMQSFW